MSDGLLSDAELGLPPQHLCHASLCKRVVPPSLFMCGWHWRMLPWRYRKAVLDAYQTGQEDRKDPTPEYIKAARAAVEWLRKNE